MNVELNKSYSLTEPSFKMTMYAAEIRRRTGTAHRKAYSQCVPYGWNSTVFTTVENFWAERDFEIPELDAEESYEKICQQILLLNPMAEEKNIRKFIRG